jgi:hypothetical protein
MLRHMLLGLEIILIMMKVVIIMMVYKIKLLILQIPITDHIVHRLMELIHI